MKWSRPGTPFAQARHQDAQGQLDEELHLLDVVGITGDQGGGPEPIHSRAENSCTRAKTARRTSRPRPIEARDENHTATMARMPTTTASASIRPPVRQM